MSIITVLNYNHDFIEFDLDKYKVFGFTGSRERYKLLDKAKIYKVVKSLPEHALVISGKCKSKKTETVIDKRTRKKITKEYINENTDRWSVKFADKRGLKTDEKPPTYPDLDKYDGRERYWYMTERNYARNQEIVDESDVLFAMMVGKKGGTWDTVTRALKKGIPILANFPTEDYWILLTKHHLKLSVEKWKK